MTEQELPGLNGQWIAWDEFPAREQDGDDLDYIQQLHFTEDGRLGTQIAKWNVAKEDRTKFWRPYASRDSRPIYEAKFSPPEKQEDDSPTTLDSCFDEARFVEKVVE